jgi:hypothetical protein
MLDIHVVVYHVRYIGLILAIDIASLNKSHEKEFSMMRKANVVP